MNERWDREIQFEPEDAALAESLDPATPPPGLKERLFQTIERIAPVESGGAYPQGLGALRAGERDFRPSQFPGVTWKKLYFDAQSQLLTMLVKMEPGSSYPVHRHARTEQCLVIEGDLIHNGHTYYPGDFTWAEPGSIDPPLETARGNLLLIIASPEDEILAN